MLPQEGALSLHPTNESVLDSLGQLTPALVVVHAVVGDGRQLAAPVVLVVDVVGHVLQVLHVGPGDERACYRAGIPDGAMGRTRRQRRT